MVGMVMMVVLVALFSVDVLRPPLDVPSVSHGNDNIPLSTLLTFFSSSLFVGSSSSSSFPKLPSSGCIFTTVMLSRPRSSTLRIVHFTGSERSKRAGTGSHRQKEAPQNQQKLEIADTGKNINDTPFVSFPTAVACFDRILKFKKKTY